MRPVLMSTLLISLPTIVFVVAELVSDVDSVATSPGVAIATAVLLLATLAQLWTAYLVEPGIVPRTPPKPPCTREGNMRKTPPKNQYIVAAGKRTELRYCLVCELFTPPRSIHCSTCNSCIMRFDVSRLSTPWATAVMRGVHPLLLTV